MVSLNSGKVSKQLIWSRSIKEILKLQSEKKKKKNGFDPLTASRFRKLGFNE